MVAALVTQQYLNTALQKSLSLVYNTFTDMGSNGARLVPKPGKRRSCVGLLDLVMLVEVQAETEEP